MLGTPPAFVLSQDQTLHKKKKFDFLAALRLGTAKIAGRSFLCKYFLKKLFFQWCRLGSCTSYLLTLNARIEASYLMFFHSPNFVKKIFKCRVRYRNKPYCTATKSAPAVAAAQCITSKDHFWFLALLRQNSNLIVDTLEF